MLFLILLDCPNTFYPIGNKCYKMMEANQWTEQHTNCLRSGGMLLAYSSNLEQSLVAVKLMLLHGVDTIFLGAQKHSNEGQWKEDEYDKTDMEWNVFSETHTMIDHKILMGKLVGGQFKLIFGHSRTSASAICQYRK